MCNKFDQKKNFTMPLTEDVDDTLHQFFISAARVSRKSPGVLPCRGQTSQQNVSLRDTPVEKGVVIPGQCSTSSFSNASESKGSDGILDSGESTAASRKVSLDDHILCEVVSTETKVCDVFAPCHPVPARAESVGRSGWSRGVGTAAPQRDVSWQFDGTPMNVRAAVSPSHQLRPVPILNQRAASALVPQIGKVESVRQQMVTLQGALMEPPRVASPGHSFPCQKAAFVPHVQSVR